MRGKADFMVFMLMSNWQSHSINIQALKVVVLPL